MRQRGPQPAMPMAELDLGRVDPVPGAHVKRPDPSRGQQPIKIAVASVGPDRTVAHVHQ